MSDVKTIRVTGRSQLKVRPDMTRVTLSLEGIRKDHSAVLALASRDTGLIRDTLLPFGFVREDLKTLEFGVEAEYESYKDKDVWKKRFVGYKYRHVLKVEFDSDNERLGRILSALAACPLDPELRLSYTVRDPEKARNELLAGAVADAKNKAQVLADAAGVTLRGILNIDYSWDRVDLEFSPVREERFMALSEPAVNGFSMDIEPDDIGTVDTVTVLWEIC